MQITLIPYSEAPATIDRIREHLRAAQPVLLPNPSPLPYMVVATDPVIVNRAKGRRDDQDVALFVPDLEPIAAHLDFDRQGLDVARHCLLERQMTVLCPLRRESPVPEQFQPSTAAGHLLLFAAHLPAVRSLCDQFTSLYVSSGNVSALPPLPSCQEVRRQFEEHGPAAGHLLIVDGDAWRDPSRRHGSTTMVRVAASGAVSLRRPGIQPWPEA